MNGDNFISITTERARGNFPYTVTTETRKVSRATVLASLFTGQGRAVSVVIHEASGDTVTHTLSD